MMNLSLIQSGETIIYHTGFLAKDRVPEFSSLPRHEALDLDAFARRLLEAENCGEGTLTQRKVEDNLYAYIFCKK